MSHAAEHLERAALADLHQAATPELAHELGLRTFTVGDALVSIASRLPASAIVINRTLGLGLGSPAREADVRQIVSAYRDAGVSRYFVQRHPDAEPAGLGSWLERAGLIRARGWQKFRRGHGPVEARPTELAIRRIGAHEGAAFGHIVADAFDLGLSAAPWLAALADRARWHIFMSFEGERPAGAGALYVQDDLAWLDFGATAPAFRQRGSQGALLAHRIEHARALGCTRMFTCTGEDVPGDPQHSYKNILRAGFHEDYVRENLAPPSAS